MSLFGDDNAIRERVNSLTDRVTREIQRREGIKARAEAELRSRRAEADIAAREAKTALQVKADGYYGEWGESPPQPIADESASRYRRRLVRDMQRHLAPGDRLSSLRFPDLRREDDAALNALEPQLFEAFKNARMDPATAPIEGERMMEQIDPSSGQRTVVFNRRESFIRDMGLPCRRVNGGVEGMRRNAETLIKQR